MKITKYGYSKFNKRTALRFAVMTPVYNYDKEHHNEDGTYVIKSCQWRFITKIDFMSKTWEAENHKKAYLFESRESAQDFCIGLAFNFTAGYVVEVLEGMEFSNNW